MTDTPPTPPRRRRGAPLHNLNALKHGFYARKYRSSDLEDLAECKFTGLAEEMTMLRVYMRGVIEQSASVSSLSESIEVLRALALATASLTRMAKAQKFLEGDPESILTEALREVTKDWKKA
jgi:hypothetical protein